MHPDRLQLSIADCATRIRISEMHKSIYLHKANAGQESSRRYISIFLLHLVLVSIFTGYKPSWGASLTVFAAANAFCEKRALGMSFEDSIAYSVAYVKSSRILDPDYNLPGFSSLVSQEIARMCPEQMPPAKRQPEYEWIACLRNTITNDRTITSGARVINLGKGAFRINRNSPLRSNPKISIDQSSESGDCLVDVSIFKYSNE